MEAQNGARTPPTPPWIAVVTVVFNDPVGFAATIDSIDSYPWRSPIEHIVVDGSSDRTAADFTRSLAREGRTCIVERDRGIYDAMNKGLQRATAQHALFLNAGDRLAREFDEQVLRAAADLLEDAVVLGYCIEGFERDRYLNPARGRERRALRSPQHQATVYPRAFYTSDHYELDFGVTADGRYTSRAIERHGAVFAATPIAEFALGGTSSTYSSFAAVADRMKESGLRRWPRLLGKYVLWKLVPQRFFYRVLASYKYTRIRDRAVLADLSAAPLVLRRAEPGRGR